MEGNPSLRIKKRILTDWKFSKKNEVCSTFIRQTRVARYCTINGPFVSPRSIFITAFVIRMSLSRDNKQKSLFKLLGQLVPSPHMLFHHQLRSILTFFPFDIFHNTHYAKMDLDKKLYFPSKKSSKHSTLVMRVVGQLLIRIQI